MNRESRPGPKSEAARHSWQVSGQRLRMLRGPWQRDAEQRLREFFDPSTWMFLPQVVLAFNAFKAFIVETTTLYDGAVTVHVDGEAPSEAEGEALGLDLLWAQQQETLEYVRGLNDCFLLRTWDNEAGCVRYESVPPCAVEAWASKSDPSQPSRVDYYHEREIDGKCMWCRDEYDMREPKAPRFAVYAWRDGDWVEVTEKAVPGTAGLPGHWPFWTTPPGPDEEVRPDRLGAPIWCWTAYHWRISNRLLDPDHGCELVDLALVACVLWTYWVGGLRDVAYQQRYMLDADVAAKPRAGQPFTASNPMMVMKLRSTEATRPGSASAWPAPMDPKAYAEAIGNFMASGALHAGLSTSDVSVSSTGLSRVSGWAIEVSGAGKRKIEKKLVKPMGVGDRHNLAGAAALANAYGGFALPTDPRRYSVVYSETPRTTEELRATADETVKLVDAGMLHPADGLRRFEPGLSDAQARAKVLEIAEFRRLLEAGGEPTDEIGADIEAALRAMAELLDANEIDVPPAAKAAIERIAAATAALPAMTADTDHAAEGM